ncbi:MAG: hypothetical protein ACRD01_15160 [Terriglobales bacterium]
MAFVRKKGKSYYLVHNVREDGHVRQVHLACLGNRPRVSEEVLDQVRQQHPQLQIDWDAVRARAAETFASPFADPEGATMLLRSVRTLREDLDELNLGLLRHRVQEQDAAGGERRIQELLGEMEALRAALEAKLKHSPGVQSLHSETGHQNTGD